MKTRFTLTIGTVAMAGALCRAAELHVAPDGNDAHPGTRAAPLKTLQAARDAIRKLKSQPPHLAAGATVWLRGGSYPITKTFELDERDSGTPAAPIVYRAREKEEVRISGGREIDPAAARPVTDPAILERLPDLARGKVLQVDLKSQGIADFGRMHRRGFGHPYVNAGLELFFNDQPLRLARWPNRGFVPIGKVLDPGSTPRTGDFSNRGARFTYDFDRPSRWKQAQNVWISGIFCWGFADDTIPVRAIDTETKTITLADAHVYGVQSGKVHGLQRAYYAFNLLEEIDEPGEWFLDRANGIAYFWPPAPLEQARLSVSLLDEPMVALEGVSHVVFRDLTFEVSRGIGVYIERGTGNRIVGCTLRNLGVVGVCIGQGGKTDPRPCGDWGLALVAERGELTTVEAVSRQLGAWNHRMYANTVWNRNAGANHGVVSCDIYQTGAGGVSLGGGDRKTLTPAGNYVLNCHIRDFNRLDRSYRSGVSIDGVGNRIAHCLIQDAPHSAIQLFGNDHIIEYNEVHRVCRETGDMGAFYMGRDPSQQGNVLRYNFFHHNGSDTTIYLDDLTSGVTVFGNVFYKTPCVVRFSGIDNIVRNNICVNSGFIGLGAVDNRAWTRAMKDPLQVLRLRKVLDVTQPPYVTRYPQLAGIFDPSPDVRRGSKICGNVFVRSEGPRVKSGDVVSDSFSANEDPGFVDAGALDFRLKPDSVVFTRIPGFQPIPFEKIGLYQDEHRKTVPARQAGFERPPVRDVKTRQCAPSFSALERGAELPGQGEWKAFAGHTGVMLGQGLIAGAFDPGTVAVSRGRESWAAIWHGVILDPARDIVLQMDACLPAPLDQKSFFELYLNRGQVGDNAACGAALVGGDQDTGRGDTVGARRDSAGPRVLAKDGLTPGHWYRLQLRIPANTRQGRLWVQDLTAGEKEPRAATFAEGGAEADLTAADRWAPELGHLDALILRVGGRAQAANIILRN